MTRSTRAGRPMGTARPTAKSRSAVDTIDFKGHYGFEVMDPEALGALYDRVLPAFPDAYLEDPHDRPRSLSGSAITSSACPTTRRSEAPTTSARRRSPRAWSTSSPRASG